MDQSLVTDPPKKSSSTRSSKGSKKSSSKKGSNRSSSRSSKKALPQRKKASYKSKAFAWLEPRLLNITTGVTLFGVILEVIAISTNSWIIIDSAEGTLKNATGKYMLVLYTGLWRYCKLEIDRSFSADGKTLDTEVSTCQRHNLYATEEDALDDKDFDRQNLDGEVKDMLKTDYTRTAIAFTIIAIVIMFIGHAFAFYALRRPRYIIKRLAALLHFMAAACLLVLNEVFVKTVEHETDVQPGGIPAGSTTRFGYSFILSWLVFVFFVLAGLIFLFMSQKKKAEHADNNDAEEDEPVEIFRR